MKSIYVSCLEDFMVAIAQLHEQGMQENGRPYSISELLNFFRDADAKDPDKKDTPYVILENSIDIEDWAYLAYLAYRFEYLEDIARELKAPMPTSTEIVNANIRYLIQKYRMNFIGEESVSERGDAVRGMYQALMKEFYGVEKINSLPDSKFKEFCQRYL